MALFLRYTFNYPLTRSLAHSFTCLWHSPHHFLSFSFGSLCLVLSRMQGYSNPVQLRLVWVLALVSGIVNLSDSSCGHSYTSGYAAAWVYPAKFGFICAVVLFFAATTLLNLIIFAVFLALFPLILGILILFRYIYERVHVCKIDALTD